MANQSSDRQRMRNDLRELAKLAAPVAAPQHAFDDADSSGYVDLSAFSAKDPRWVDRELARAKGGAPPPLPPPRPALVGVPTPASMAPVALESLLTPDETASVRPSRAKRALYGVAGLASIGVVGFLAVSLARHPPPPAPAVQAPPPVAVEPPATPAAAPDTATAAAAAPSSPSAPPASVAAPPATSSVSTASTATKGAKTRHTATHAAAHPATSPSPAPVRAAAARPVTIPASSPGGGNSLMDLIKQSVAKGK